MLQMSEAQQFIALQTFMAYPSVTIFQTSLGGMSRQGGVTSWPEDFQHFLTRYATPAAM